MDRWISRQGTVVGEGGPVLVEFQQGCLGGGAGCRGCGRSSVHRVPVTVLGLTAPRYGDTVTLRVRSSALTRVAAACFALPLAALLVGAAVGRWLAASAGINADLAGGSLGFALLGLALVVVVRHGDMLVRLLDLRASQARAAQADMIDPVIGKPGRHD